MSLSLADLDMIADGPEDPNEGLIKNGRYQIPDPVTGKKSSQTRASGYGKTLGDSYMLNQWHLRMTATGFVLRPDLLEEFRKTLVNFQGTFKEKRNQNRICRLAAEAAGAEKGANLGTFIHNLTEEVDAGRFPTIPEHVSKGVTSYQDVMQAFNFRAVSRFTEQVVYNNRDGVNCAGRMDRVLEAVDGLEFEGKQIFFPGELLIGDVKTAKNLGYSWLEVVQQLAIYGNASHIWHHDTKTHELMPKVNTKWAVIMSIPAESQLCEFFLIDIEAGWELCKLNLLVRKARLSKNLAFRLPTPAQLSSTEEDEGLDWRASIDKAVCVQDLSAVFNKAYARGEWTDELEAYGLGKMMEIRG